MTVKGIDVSAYQSSTYSTSGLAFVFVKATEGTSYTSPQQAAQAAHARAAGLTVGWYHFMHPGNAKAQAAYFVEKCASQAGEILACDWEPTSSGTPSNADKDTFIKEVKRLRPDHRVVLYCDLSRWKNVDKTSYCGDGLWIADPNSAAGKPDVDHPWTFHQYGISGTDVDVANFPSAAALKSWATGTTPPAPPTPPEPPVATNTQMLTDLTSDLLRIGSLTEKDAKGNPAVHAAGYYLAHVHYDALTLHDKVDALTAKVDALTALVAKLTPQS